jgi:hypothetical protein
VIDLNAPVRTVAGVELAAASPDTPSGTPAFYVLPPAPRVAVRDGVPMVELLRFVRDGKLAGGHLRLETELVHPEARMAEVRAFLAAELHEDESAIELRPLLAETASAEVLFAGIPGDGEGGLATLVRQGFGRTAAGFSPPHTAIFAVDLDPESVRVVEAALRSGGAPVGVIYRLAVEGLWPAQRIVARVDWGRVYDHFSAQYKQGAFLVTEDVRKISEQLVENRAIDIQVVQGIAPPEDGGPPAADPGPAMAWIQRELVERFCEPVMPLDRTPAHASLGTVGEILGVGTAYAVKSLTQIERAVAEVDFQRAVVVSRTLTPQAHLADLLGDAPAGEHIADAGLDHPFFQRFSLRVATARPLAEIGLSEVVAHVEYGTAQDSLRLTPENPEARFECWADASAERTWTLRPEVTFDAASPLDPGEHALLEPLAGASRSLTLDLERLLGIARYEVRGTTDPRVLLTQAVLTAKRGEERLAEREIGLTPQNSVQTVWFRGLQPGDRVQVAARHLLADGRAVAAPPFDADTRVVLLPPPFPGSLTVQLLSDDDWTDLERVVVALQKREELPAGTFVFDAPGKSTAVSLDMPDPTDRTYRHHVTRAWSSGVVEEDGWVTTDLPVLVVGRVAANKLVVDVAPVGLELPEAGVMLFEVELSYIDAENQVRDQRTAVLRARADRFHWEVAIHDPNRRRYEYRVTTHRTSGETKVGSWIPSTDRLLLIPVTRA